jgi:hypothetical protein
MVRCEEITWSATVPLWKSLSTEGGFVTAHDGPVWGPVWQAAPNEIPRAEPAVPIPPPQLLPIHPPIHPPIHQRRTSPVPQLPAGEPDSLPLGIAFLIPKSTDSASSLPAAFATMIEQVDAQTTSRPVRMPVAGPTGEVTVEPLHHAMLPGVVISKPLGTVRPWIDEPQTPPAPMAPQRNQLLPYNRTVYREQTVPAPKVMAPQVMAPKAILQVDEPAIVSVMRPAEPAFEGVQIPPMAPPATPSRVVRNPILPENTPETRSPYHQLPMPAPRPFHPETSAAPEPAPKPVPEEKPSVPVPGVPIPGEVREPILAKLGLPK